MPEINAQFIMNTITEWVQDKKQIPAEQWITSALKLEMLMTYEHDKLVELEGEVSKITLLALEGQEKRNVSEARLKVKADPKYQEFRKQELFVKRVEEVVRLAKHYAKLVSFQ